MIVNELNIKGHPNFASETEPHRFQLAPGLNIIRGTNGAGKTTVLESLAILGHCNIMRWDANAATGNEGISVEAKIRLNSGEIAFVQEVSQSLREALNDDEVRRKHGDFLKPFLTLVRPAGVTNVSNEMVSALALIGKQAPDVEVKILQKETHPDENSDWPSGFKVDLSKEDILSERWSIWSSDFGASALALQLLTTFNRPNSSDYAKPSLDDLGGTPRRLWCLSAEGEGHSSLPYYLTRTLAEGKSPNAAPGVVSYFNTDMYEFGVGLDIRESPKDFTNDFLLMCIRLGIIRSGGVPGEDNVPIENAFFGSGAMGEQFARIINRGVIDDAALTSAPNFVRAGSYLHPRIPPRHKNKEPISSGENQALFLSIMLSCFRSHQSLFMLDEPDLHLSIPAAGAMYELLLECAEQRDDQIVVVTHLPFLFSDRLRDYRNGQWVDQVVRGRSRNKKSSNPERKDVALIFLDRGPVVLYGQQAKIRADQLHRDEMSVFMKQMQIPEKEYPIISLKKMWSWSKRKLKRNET